VSHPSLYSPPISLKNSNLNNILSTKYPRTLSHLCMEFIVQAHAKSRANAPLHMLIRRNSKTIINRPYLRVIAADLDLDHISNFPWLQPFLGAFL